MENLSSINFKKEEIGEAKNADKAKFPYLIFRLQEKYYAVNCSLVAGIMELPGNVVKTPCPSQYVYGIFELRHEFIPMVALRTLFNMSDIETERLSFSDYMDERIGDHLNWVEELRHCTKEQIPFTLGINPHKCKLGRWLDSYQPSSFSIKSQLDKISLPHEALHKSAQKLSSQIEGLEDGEREKAIEDFFVHIQNEYIAKIVEVLEGLKILHNDNLHEMVIVLERENRNLAVIADEIISVEDMDTEYDAENMIKMDASQYISGVRHSAGLDKDVLIVDDEVLIDTILSVI